MKANPSPPLAALRIRCSSSLRRAGGWSSDFSIVERRFLSLGSEDHRRRFEGIFERRQIAFICDQNHACAGRPDLTESRVGTDYERRLDRCRRRDFREFAPVQDPSLAPAGVERQRLYVVAI